MKSETGSTGFVPPPYPFDVPAEVRALADAMPGGAVDLSRGVPCDPVPDVVAVALAEPDPARPYPPSIGTPELLDAVVGWCGRRIGVEIQPDQVGACVGTKELVTGLPHLLKLRNPDRDTVLYPAVSYPSYEMGAVLAGCRAVPVPLDASWRIDLGHGGSRCCQTSATWSSPGTARRVPSSSTEPKGCWLSTPFRSDPTWPGCALASTPVTRTWPGTCGRPVDTRGC